MGNTDFFMSKYSAFHPHRICRTNMGFQTPIGTGNAIAKSLYCGMKPIASWGFDPATSMHTGGVFNLEFSPEGSLLVAACEKRSIQIFDPLTHQRIHSVIGAHRDCVNCVKFLDSRMFATCSDDTTIALWDVRNLSKKIRSLSGHSKWVKNIEFSVKDKLLVTSGLDGSIYTWDINSYTEANLVYQRVFHTSSLMRCRLAPDARQMVMCTTGGLLVIIHNLNLNKLAYDLYGFKPNMYRLMQMSHQVIPVVAMYDHLFDLNRKENRVEFVTDFPEGNDAEVVSALQIHPQGWSALSRNISHNDRSEWTCIHDIQPQEETSSKSTRDSEATILGPRSVTRRNARRPRLRPRPVRAQTANQPPPSSVADDSPEQAQQAGRESSQERSPPRLRPRHHDSAADPTLPFPPPPPALDAASAPEPVEQRPTDGPSSSGSAGGLDITAAEPPTDPPPPRRIINDVWEAAVTVKQYRLLHDVYRSQVRANFNMQRITGVSTGITAPVVAAMDQYNRPSTSGHVPLGMTVESAPCQTIRKNADRLLYYIEETNEGRGFIKELCYSGDGRIVCSPFGRGMRLLSLDQRCQEQPDCAVPGSPPQRMHELGQSLGIHQDLVVSSKFSPRFHLLVTGCLEGKIVWYQPYSGESLC